MSLLEGITERTTKADMLKRLREGAKKLAGYEDQRVARMQEIEEKVRASLKPVTLKKVIITSTPEEWKDAAAFLEEFEGYLPSALARIQEGAREAAGLTTSDSAKA